MTEAEWNTCTEPQAMLEFLKGKASDRKLRLFACACCSRLLTLMRAKRSTPDVLVVAEGYADDRSLEKERAKVYESAQMLAGVMTDCGLWGSGAADVYAEAVVAVSCANSAASGVAEWSSMSGFVSVGPDVQADLLRDLFGPLLFRQVGLDLACLSRTVVGLAATIYEEKSFDCMEVLADALEEAGCQDRAILGHCRRHVGEHVRGCWVIDLVRSVD